MAPKYEIYGPLLRMVLWWDFLFLYSPLLPAVFVAGWPAVLYAPRFYLPSAWQASLYALVKQGICHGYDALTYQVLWGFLAFFSNMGRVPVRDLYRV